MPEREKHINMLSRLKVLFPTNKEKSGLNMSLRVSMRWYFSGRIWNCG